MDKTDCQRLRSRLIDYLEQELPPDRAQEMAEHLARCGTCRAEYDELKATLEQARDFPVPDLGREFRNGFPDRVVEAARTQQAKEDKPSAGETGDSRIIPLDWRRFDWPQAMSRAAVVLILAGGIALLARSLYQPPRTPPLPPQAQADKTDRWAALARDAFTELKAAHTYGFSDTAGVNYFVAGGMIAATLAVAGGRDRARVKYQLDALSRVVSPQAPPRIVKSISRLYRELDRPATDNTAVLNQLAQLQKELSILAGTSSPRDELLFRTGVWTLTLQLVALAGKDELLEDTRYVDSLIQQHRRLNSPAGVIKALTGIRAIMKQGKYSKRSRDTLVTLTKRIQMTLT